MFFIKLIVIEKVSTYKWSIVMVYRYVFQLKHIFYEELLYEA